MKDPNIGDEIKIEIRDIAELVEPTNGKEAS
jgi:hypothetical protein